MRVRVLLVLLLCGFATRVGAAPILYNFTASVTVTKFNFDAPITSQEEAHWFPELQNGGTYLASGQLGYDDDGNGQAWVNLGRYTWTVFGGPLGPFFDSFPTITRGLPCVLDPGGVCFFANGDDFYGRDGFFNVAGTNGTPTGGSFTIWGTGDHKMNDGWQTTAVAWQGTINTISVPEPATALLLALGAGFALRRRRLSSSDRSPTDRGSQA